MVWFDIQIVFLTVASLTPMNLHVKNFASKRREVVGVCSDMLARIVDNHQFGLPHLCRVIIALAITLF